MKKLSEMLSNMASKAKELEEKTQASEDKMNKDYRQWVDGVEQNINAEQSAFEERVDKLSDNAKSYWKRFKQSWKDDEAQAKSEYETWKHELGVEDAEAHVMATEEDAEVSVQYAIAAMEEAERYVAKAVKARKKTGCNEIKS